MLARLLSSQAPRLILVRRVLAVLLVVLGAAQLKAPLGFLQPEHLKRKDIVQEYAMARAIRDGFDPYAPVDVLLEQYVPGPSATQLSHPTPHPPTLGLLFVPLSLLDFRSAALLWLGVELLCLFIAVRWMARATEVRLGILATVALCAGLLNWYPLWVEMALGQLTVPLLALLAAAWWAVRTDRIELAGALLGLALWIKPLPWPLLLFFAHRERRRGLVVAIVVAGLGYLVAAVVLGPATILRYIAEVLPEVTGVYQASWRNIALPSTAWKLFHGASTGPSGGLVAPLIEAPRLAAFASAALPAVLLLAGAWTVFRVHDAEVSFSMLIGVSILLGPVSWPHYLVLGLIPATLVLRRLYVRGLPVRETNQVLALCMLLAVDWVRLATLLVMTMPRPAAQVTQPSAVVHMPWLTTVAALCLTLMVARLPGDSQ